MLKAKCIAKARDKNNNIIGYKLQDQQGNTTTVKPEALKSAIKSNKIEVINLTLTSDNRLIDTTPKSQPTPNKQQKSSKISSEEQNIKSMIDKAKTLGYQISEIPTYCKHKCILISKDSNNHIIYIPDDVTILNGGHTYIAISGMYTQDLTFTMHIIELQGHIKVIGGHNLKDTNAMFDDCKAQSLDLSNFNTSKVTDMSRMFDSCRAQSLDLSSFDTSNVTSMHGMFECCQAQSINLSSFDTSNVTDMSRMFSGCKVQSLDLSSFDTSKVTDMNHMFYSCQAQSIVLYNFNTRKVTDMSHMFAYCQAQSLNLYGFNTSNVTDMHGMFECCEVQSLDLPCFDLTSATDINEIFKKCKA